ncbi:MAG: hypothetical protein PVF59_11870, partial [Desulfobacterales bacterium]
AWRAHTGADPQHEKLGGVHPETASFGPGRRSLSFEILDVAGLRLWFQKCCGLGLSQNLPFLDGQ